MIASFRAFASRWSRSGPLRAVAKLSAGQFAAAAIPFAAAPLLGRIYVPSDYGALATYMAIGQLIATFSTFQLQQGIIAERTERRAEHLVFVCFAVAGLVSLVSLAIGVGAYVWMAGDEHYGAARAWMLALPLTTFAGGSMAAISALANRKCRFGAMARLPVVLVAVTVSTSILFGLAGWGVHGLFASYLLGQAVSTANYWRLFGSMRSAEARRPSRPQSLAMLRRHRRFAYYTLPSAMIGTFNQQIPVFALSALGAAPTLGAFARARQLVGAPMTLLGSAIATVFRQRAAEQYRTTGSCSSLFARTFLLLAAAGAIPMMVLILFGPSLFIWFLGPNWREAGEVARILAPMLFMQLICSPLSSVFFFAGRQSEDLILMTSAFVLVAAVTTAAWLVVADARSIIIGFSASWFVVYASYVVRGFQIAGGSRAA